MFNNLKQSTGERLGLYYVGVHKEGVGHAFHKKHIFSHLTVVIERLHHLRAQMTLGGKRFGAISMRFFTK